MTEQQTPASVVERLSLIVSELRGLPHVVETCREAAALIERLSAEREGLREALEKVRNTTHQSTGYSDLSARRAAFGVSEAALTQGESRQSGWQDIATAPKDGTVIDLWMTDETGAEWRESDAYYVTDCTDDTIVYQPDGSWTTPCRKRDGWFAPGHDYDGHGFCDVPKHFNPHPRQQKVFFTLPTHWMPLPAAPTPAGGGE